MSAKEKRRENSRKIRRYNRARNSGKNNTGRSPVRKERDCIKKFVYSILTLVITGTIIFGVITFFAPSQVKKKVDRIKRLQYPQGYSESVKKYSRNYSVDEDLVYAVIRTESHFQNDDQSGAGAMGLMQITSPCFEFLQRNIPDDKNSYDDSALYDPDINIKFGTYFLSYLMKKYDNVEKTALAAYNAGFGIVDQWLQDKSISKDGKNLDIIPYSETARYVVKVCDARKMYKELY